MKITNNRKNPIAFKDVSAGEVFVSVTSPNFYIRTSEVMDDEGNVISNSVNLETGLAHYFDGNIAVMVVNAELIIT